MELISLYLVLTFKHISISCFDWIDEVIVIKPNHYRNEADNMKAREMKLMILPMYGGLSIAEQVRFIFKFSFTQ